MAKFVTFLWEQFFEDHCPSTAVALTYQTLFAIVPLLTVTYTVFSMFEAFAGLGHAVEEFLFNNIVPENISVVQEYLRGFSDQARKLSLPSLALLAVTALLMLVTIEKTLNEIWRVKEPRHGFQRLLMYWAVLTLGPLLGGCALAISTYVFSMPLISHVTTSSGFLLFLPMLLGASFFTLIYVAVPNCRIPFGHAVIGGCCAAVAFEMAKFLFGVLVANTDFAVIYGTFAAVPLLLLWIYLCWIIVLLGAEFVKALTVCPMRSDQARGEPLVQVLHILALFKEAQIKGLSVNEKDVFDLADKIELQEWNGYRSRLLAMDLIRVVEGGGLVLCKDLREVVLWDLYRALPWPLPTDVLGDNAWEMQLSELLKRAAGHNKQEMSLSVAALLEAT